MSTAPAVTAGTSLLDRVRAQRQAEADAARATMQLVVAWAAVHPAPGLDDLPLSEVYADHEVELAGPGAPGVSEFAVVELVAALGMSTAAGKRYVGDALELAHRLPSVWARIIDGDLEAWKARTIAQRTKQLSSDAAAWIDVRVAPVAHKIGPAKLTGLIDRAIALFDLESHVEATLSETYVSITPAPGLGDLAHLQATLHLDDALAVEAAVAARAHALLETQPELSLDERRALALGHLADDTLGPEHRDLTLVVHLGEPDLGPAHLGRVYGLDGEREVTTEAVAAWCQRPGTRVTIKPVIDLNGPISTTGYVPTARLRDQITLLSPTCAFPHCTVRAERCDLDHITPWDAGGATTTSNLAPLCRLHHRAKTHDNWAYSQPTPGTYDWISPHGHRYRRDRDGTVSLT